MAKRKIPNAMPWRKSTARSVLLHDIEQGIFPADLSIKDAWDAVYSRMTEFVDVPFWQFEEQAKAHQKQVEKKNKQAIDDAMRLMNYCANKPAPHTF